MWKGENRLRELRAAGMAISVSSISPHQKSLKRNSLTLSYLISCRNTKEAEKLKSQGSWCCHLYAKKVYCKATRSIYIQPVPHYRWKWYEWESMSRQGRKKKAKYFSYQELATKEGPSQAIWVTSSWSSAYRCQHYRTIPITLLCLTVRLAELLRPKHGIASKMNKTSCTSLSMMPEARAILLSELITLQGHLGVQLRLWEATGITF